jgi:hypothetical protein
LDSNYDDVIDPDPPAKSNKSAVEQRVARASKCAGRDVSTRIKPRGVQDDDVSTDATVVDLTDFDHESSGGSEDNHLSYGGVNN